MVFVGMTARQIAHAQAGAGQRAVDRARPTGCAGRSAPRRRSALLVVGLSGWLLALDPGKLPDERRRLRRPGALPGSGARLRRRGAAQPRARRPQRPRGRRRRAGDRPVAAAPDVLPADGVVGRADHRPGHRADDCRHRPRRPTTAASRSTSPARGASRSSAITPEGTVTGINANVTIRDEDGNAPDPASPNVADLPASTSTSTTSFPPETTEG